MYCNYHEDRKADFICKECEKAICKDCAVNHNGRIICKQCAEDKGLPIVKNQVSYHSNDYNPNVVHPKPKKRVSSFWATLFSFVPGVGHMYLGLMKRGIQIGIAFWGLIALATLFSAGYLVLFDIVIWFYSVFDCYHLRKKLQRGEEAEDDLVIDMDLKNVNLYYVGIGLVGIGALVLANELLEDLVYMIGTTSILGGARNIPYQILRFFRSSLLPVVLIIGGTLLLKKVKKDSVA